MNGGIWKTTDGGGIWKPLTDNKISLSMGGMALEPGNPNRILAGFGQFANSLQGGPRQECISPATPGHLEIRGRRHHRQSPMSRHDSA